MKISIARKTAYDYLLRIERDLAYSGDLLATTTDLDQRDLNLVYKLTLGVLRNQILIDHVIGTHSKKRPEKLDLEVLTILRLGIYQLLFMDRIPDYSAVNEMVELTRYARKKSASGFVNAVLRKSAGKGIIKPELPELESVALETSHPVWLLRKWSAEFGMGRAVSIARANNTEPTSAFRFTSRYQNLPETERLLMRKRILEIEGVRRSEICEGGFVAGGIVPDLRDLADEGFVYFQDEASQLVGETVSKHAGTNFLDVCAAPGGKAALVAGTKDVRGVAGDLHFHRAKSLLNNARNQGVRLDVVCFDAERDLPFGGIEFDSVLVDAPCSGTGTIRRNPEIRYKVTVESIAKLHKKQLRIINSASKAVRSGGSLFYSTCSLERDENEAVVESFLSDNRNFTIVGAGKPADRAGNGVLRTFPTEDGSDGFFAVRLRRN